MRNLRKFVLPTIFLISSVSLQAAISEELSFVAKGMKLKRDWMAKDAGPIWALAALPNGNLLATFKSGGLKIFDVKTKTWEAIANPPKSVEHGQGGLMDVVLAPDFEKSKTIYLSYAKEIKKSEYTTALASAQLDGNTLKDVKEFFVATGSSSKGEHFGGRIVVDSADSIWVTIGERGVRDNAQKLDNHLGKILRLGSDGKAHPDNPFVKDKKGLPEIYSYGHRNPQGLARHPVSQELWEHEHGPRGGDEINRIEKGQDYGWPKATFGKEYWGPGIGEKHIAGMKDPMVQWTPSIGPSGMMIYNGEMFPAWKGLVFSGALALAHLNVTEFKGGQKIGEDRFFKDDSQRVREVEQGVDGAIWYATDQGNLFRITRLVEK